MIVNVYKQRLTTYIERCIISRCVFNQLTFKLTFIKGFIMKTHTIKNELTVADVVKMFNDANRGDNFTYEGIEALLNKLEECSSYDQGAIDLDIIGLCCDFTESTPYDLMHDFSYVDGLDDNLDDEENLEIVMDYLNNNTTVWELENGNILYANF